MYFDTGPLIDYLSRRGHVGTGLRLDSRRGRSLQMLCDDAEKLLNATAKDQLHHSYTSALTFYEAEEALFRALSLSTKSVSHASVLLVPLARAIAVQVEVLIRTFGVEVIPLDFAMTQQQLRERELEIRGVRAADSLHIVSALSIGADIFVSADQDLLDLDRVFTNSRGTRMLCLDSDAALTALRP